jgi:hypothetical protein
VKSFHNNIEVDARSYAEGVNDALIECFTIVDHLCKSRKGFLRKEFSYAGVDQIKQKRLKLGLREIMKQNGFDCEVTKP